MTSVIGMWSSSKDKYLEETRENGVYLIEGEPWANWVKETDNLTLDQFKDCRHEYESVIKRFRVNADTISDVLTSLCIEYQSAIEHQISSYLFFNRRGNILDGIPHNVQDVFVDKIKSCRKQLFDTIKGYSSDDKYETISVLYQDLCNLDTELKADGYIAIWNHILGVVEFNKNEMERSKMEEEDKCSILTIPVCISRSSNSNPYRLARKTASVIKMRKVFRNTITHYVELENVFIKKVLVYMSSNSLYRHVST